MRTLEPYSAPVLPATIVPNARARESRPPNKLYYGDNLAVLRDYIPSASVDLIYLDPGVPASLLAGVRLALQLPPGLQRSLRGKDGARSASQITAFKDTWEWNEEAARRSKK